jgi:cation diffusion facilitator CzcD-associated flavoprotein CzcO
MPTLRTPKYLTGPDCGIPALTYRAWHDARHAEGAVEPWEALDRIPRGRWMDYLRWLRRVTGVPVTNGVEVTGIAPAAPAPPGPDRSAVPLALALRHADGRTGQILARQVIVANGIEGGGRWTIPQALCADLPTACYAHTADPIDPARLRGARVAVLGLGASALDNAGLALDAGARAVTLCFRRAAVPVIEARAWLENTGFLRGFGDLDDTSRWAVMHRLLGAGAPPPAWSLTRCTDDPRFDLRPATPWLGTRWTGTEVEIATPAGALACDFVIFGTGAVTRLNLRPELAAAAPLAMLWRDRPACADPGHAMADYPWLGPGFELVERRPGAAPWLSRLRLFNWAATASLGICAASITGMKFGLDRLIPATVRALYAETAADHIARMPWPGGGAGPE